MIEITSLITRYVVDHHYRTVHSVLIIRTWSATGGLATHTYYKNICMQTAICGVIITLVWHTTCIAKLRACSP